MFFFPTLGENFGHVIHESLAAGTPVLISDQTPWVGLSEKGAGWELPLDNKSAWVNIITTYFSLAKEQKRRMSLEALQRANATNNTGVLSANRRVILNSL